jgi:hypothetical protein
VIVWIEFRSSGAWTDRGSANESIRLSEFAISATVASSLRV